MLHRKKARSDPPVHVFSYFKNTANGRWVISPSMNIFEERLPIITSNKCKIIFYSGVARGVAGVAEATPIFPVLLSKFGKKIWIKKTVFTAGYTNLKILPTSLMTSII